MWRQIDLHKWISPQPFSFMAFLTTAPICFQFFRRQTMVLGCPDFLATSGFFFLSTLCPRSIFDNIDFHIKLLPDCFFDFLFNNLPRFMSRFRYSWNSNIVPPALVFKIFHLRTLFIKSLLKGANFTLSVFEFSRHCIEIFDILP